MERINNSDVMFYFSDKQGYIHIQIYMHSYSIENIENTKKVLNVTGTQDAQLSMLPE